MWENYVGREWNKHYHGMSLVLSASYFLPPNLGNLIPTHTKYGILKLGHRQIKILYDDDIINHYNH